MKSISPESLPIIGTPLEGGFYAGHYAIDDKPIGLIISPKAIGQHPKAIVWNKSEKSVAGALSYVDGLANTQAMAEAGSKLAQWMRGLRIDGFEDWYLPAQDELEILYRNLKPATVENWCYARAGINLSALPPTRPYTPDHPVQTMLEAFRKGGPEAFDLEAYWSSTQHAASASYAWSQDFYHGTQYRHHKSVALRARAVRRFAL